MSFIEILNQNQGAINVVLVLALVLVTGWYAKKVNEQTKLMSKDRKRNIILDEIQRVLTPTLYNLEIQNKAIRENEIYWYKPWGEGKFQGLFKLFYGGVEYRGAFKDVIEKVPDLEVKFRSHDKLYDKLNELYTEAEKEIRTPKLKERLKVLVNEFNKSKVAPYKLHGDHFKKPEEIFGNFIINKYNPKRNPDAVEPHIDFWEEFKDELLEFRNTPLIKKLQLEINDIVIQLKELNGDIIEKIRDIIENYRKEYHFTEYEIDPKLKEFDEWTDE